MHSYESDDDGVCIICEGRGCGQCVIISENNAYKEHIIQKEREREESDDPVNHPTHYTNHPSGIECIQITEHMGFNLGNATKYIWRCDLKEKSVEDLKKAIFYIEREIALREAKFIASSP